MDKTTNQIEMKPVTSSNIAAIGYQKEGQILRVLFTTGVTYEYEGVPVETAKEFMEADSVGKYFHKNIRKYWAGKKLEPVQEKPVRAMKKIKTKIGYIAYETTSQVTELLGGRGICDECNCFAPVGYLVPVLNHYQCPKCFKEWSSRGNYYPEDIPIEQRNAAYYESVIPVTDEGGK